MYRFYIGYVSYARPFLPGRALAYFGSFRVEGGSGVASQDRIPTSDEAATGTWSGTPGSRWDLVKDYPDNVPSGYLEHGTVAGGITFGFTPFNIPTGVSIICVQVRAYSFEPVAGLNNWRGRVKVGGNYYNSSETVSPNAVAYYDGVSAFTTNPNTGIAWTVDDVNGIGANALEAIGIGSTDANPIFRISCVKVQVVYAVAHTGTDYVDLEQVTVGSPTLPALGDWLADSLTQTIVARVIPQDGDPTQQYYLYPSPDEKIYHGAFSGNVQTPQVGDVVRTQDVWDPEMWDEITEVGEGWFKTAPYQSYPRLIWVGGEDIEVRHETSYGNAAVYPWAPDLIPQRYMKFDVRILSLASELFDVAGYEQPYRRKVRMKLLLREEIPE
jgi:hypothetical protein